MGGSVVDIAGQARTSPPARTWVRSFGIAFFSPAPRRKNRNERVEFIQSPGDADDPGHVDAGVPANLPVPEKIEPGLRRARGPRSRSEEHTSALQSLIRSSYAVFCLKQ